jgi:hypothetical protein
MRFSSRRSRFVAAATLVAFVASSTAASAQTEGVQTEVVPAPIYGAPLRLESDTPHTHYKVFAGRREKIPWFECAAPCTYMVPTGEYRVEASGPEMSNGKKVVVVDRDTRVTTYGGSSSAKWAGLTIAIVGTATAAIGLTGALLESMECDGECSSQRSEQVRRESNGFLIAAAIGAGASILGWVMFANNRTQVVAEPTYGPRVVSIGVGPTSGGGAAFGALGTF